MGSPERVGEGLREVDGSEWVEKLTSHVRRASLSSVQNRFVGLFVWFYQYRVSYVFLEGPVPAGCNSGTDVLAQKSEESMLRRAARNERKQAESSNKRNFRSQVHLVLG